MINRLVIKIIIELQMLSCCGMACCKEGDYVKRCYNNVMDIIREIEN